MTKRLSRRSEEDTKKPVRTHAEGGQVEPVLGAFLAYIAEERGDPVLGLKSQFFIERKCSRVLVAHITTHGLMIRLPQSMHARLQ